ncbi:hypothetical protein [Planctomycetes bacterium TBK1r]|uniref:Uncharacterized protein n=1 Tax=Stieleria magnilauensis TaxID=2527963 RepID=A0ABX5XV17_9BACT|nr:hypothetical protein TBK1r_48900 [Planctomycetes bacterium TBK1r]
METSDSESSDTIEMPESTSIPFFASVSIAMMGIGLMTSLVISAAGVLILVATIVQWSRIMADGVGEMEVPLVAPEHRAKTVQPSSRPVAHARPNHPQHRSIYPAKVHPYRLGLLAGLIGCGVMAAVAMLWSHLSGHEIWYPANLLASIVLTDLGRQPIADLAAYNQAGLIVASVLHVTISLLIGLAFSVLLPMLPRSPVAWGGIVIPLLWSAVVYGALSLLNPPLSRQIPWAWFVGAQAMFGLTVGGVISLGGRRRAEMVQSREESE